MARGKSGVTVQAQGADEMQKKLLRILNKADPTAEERAALGDITAVFAEHVTRKAQFDEVWESPDNLESFVLSIEGLKLHLDFMMRAQRKKDIYIPSPILDNILTIAFVGQWVWLAYILLGARPLDSFPDVPLLVVFAVVFVGVALAVLLTKHLSIRAVFRKGMCFGKPLSGPIQMKKWTDQSWQLVVHSSMTVYELWLLNTTEHGVFSEPGSSFWPHKTVFRPADRLVVFYLCQLAVWVFTCIIHRFFMERIKDYFMMYLHHLITIALLAGSFQYNFVRVGLIVVFIHDASDIFVDTLKMVNYMKLADRKGWFLSEIAFGVNMVSWVYFRHYLYPFFIIHQTVTHGYAYTIDNRGFHEFDDDLTRRAYTNLAHGLVTGDVEHAQPMAVLIALLMSLEVLHVIWFHLFLNILWRIVTENTAEASRKEYEGDSDDEDADRPKQD